MYLGLAVSLLLHAAVMSWALVSIQSAREFNMPRTEPVSVEFISPNDLAKMRQGSRQSSLKEAQARRSEKTDQTPKESRRPTPLASASPPPADDPPPPKEEAKAKEQPKPAEQKAAPPPPPPPPKAEAKAEPDKAALEQKLAELSKEPVGLTPEELQKIEEDKVAEHRRAEEQRQAEELKKAEEQRKAEEQKKAEEERKAEEQKKAEEERKAEEKRQVEEQRKEEERKAEEQRKLEQQRLAEEQRKAEEKRQAEEKRKAELKRLADKKKADEKKRREAEAKAKLDLDRLSALIDKSEPKSAPAAAPQPNQPTTAKGPVMGDRDGRDSINAANEATRLLGMIISRVKACWNIQAGMEGANQLVPIIEFELNRDGSVRGMPRVVNPQGSERFRAAADAAMRAVLECQTYDLPQDKYDMWAVVKLRFDPSQMFR